MTRRESRVINAFLNCIKNGEFTVEYAIVLIEDNARYGWLSDAAKDWFYDELSAMEPEEADEPEPEEPEAEPEPDGEAE